MKRTVISLAVIFVVMQLITMLPVGISEAAPDRPDVLEHRVISGETEQLGGGSYLLVRLNDTMRFGIVHGNERTKAPITIFTSGMDTIAYVKQKNGTIPVRTTTFSIYRLNSLVEFNDTNRNGRMDRSGYSNSLYGFERTYKRLNLSLNWEFSGVRSKTTREGYLWEFSLVARNLSYSDSPQLTADSSGPASITAVSRNKVLELLRFDIRISLTREGRSTILYTYSLDTAGTWEAATSNIIERERRKIDYDGARVNWKMDHRILGWDFDKDNRDPKLLLGFTLTHGRAYDRWLELAVDSLLKNIGGTSRVTMPLKGTASTIWNEEDNRIGAVEEEALDEGSISIKDREERSRLYWRAGLEKTPHTDSERTSSKLFIYDLDPIGPDSDIWSNELLGSRTGTGISVTGGYTYPPLSLIVHDPGVETLGFRTPQVIRDDGGKFDSAVVEFIMENTTTTVVFSLLMIFTVIATAAILTLSKRNALAHDQELKWEKEEELFTVSRPKKDWDSLRVK